MLVQVLGLNQADQTLVPLSSTCQVSVRITNSTLVLRNLSNESLVETGPFSQNISNGEEPEFYEKENWLL